MSRRRIVPLLALSAWLGFAATAGAAADPDLIVLEAKVKAVALGVNVLAAQLAVLDQQLQDRFAISEAGLLELGDARRRDFEALLLQCALKPGKCVPPSLLASVLEAECMGDPKPPIPGEHEHDTGFDCPMREILKVILADREAAEKSGLDRDYAKADQHLSLAIAAARAGDGVKALEEACASFKYLACP